MQDIRMVHQLCQFIVQRMRHTSIHPTLAFRSSHTDDSDDGVNCLSQLRLTQLALSIAFANF
jgi:hypothetical protein